MCIAINLREYYCLLQNRQRRDSLGSTTKIARLSKGSTRKFETRRSQSSFSSNSEVFADNESTNGQADLLVNGMRLRSEKNLDGSQRRSAEVGRRARCMWTPSTKGNKRSSDPTLSQVRTSNGRKSKRRRRQSSLDKQSKNSMMSSISPSKEQTGSKAKKIWKSLYDERMASLRTEGLSSSYDHPEVFHAIPKERHEQEGVVRLADQAHV